MVTAQWVLQQHDQKQDQKYKLQRKERTYLPNHDELDDEGVGLRTVRWDVGGRVYGAHARSGAVWLQAAA
jgi:hypothetical protein